MVQNRSSAKEEDTIITTIAFKLWEMLVRHRQVLPVQVQLFGETVSRLFHFFGFQLLQLQLSFQLSGALLEMVHRLLKNATYSF